MALATLSIDVVARLAKLEENMEQAARVTEKNAARAQAAMDRLKSNAMLVGGSLAGMFTFSEVVQFVEATTDAIDALNDVKDATGASIENISGLEDIAIRTGGSLEDVSAILVKFNAVLKEADGKNGVSQALKAIGLEADELRKMDPALALQKTAVALAEFEDNGNKARIVQELFGKSIKDAAPFLNDLAEAGKLNGKVTAEQAAEAEKFNKQLFAVKGSIIDVARSIVSELLPTLTSMGDQLRDGIAAYGSFSKALLDVGWNVDPTKSLNENLTDTVVKIREAREELEELKRRQAGPQGFIRGMLNSPAVAKQLEDQIATMERREAYLRMRQKGENAGRGSLSTLSPAASDRPGLPALSTPDAAKKKADKEQITEAERYLDSLKKQLQGLKDLSAEETVLADIQAGRIKDVNAQQAGLMLDQAALIDQAKANKKMSDELDEIFASGIQEAQEREASWREEANRLFEASLTPAEKLAAELQHINELYRTGAFGEIGSEQALSKMGKVIDATKASADKLTDGAKEMAEAFKDAIFEGKDLSKALEAIAMKRLIFEPLSKSIDGFFSSIAKGMSGGASAGASTGSSGGDIDYAGLVMKAGSMLFGGFFEDGGYLGPGKWGIAGEAGPEPIFGGKSGLTVVPNKAGQSSGAPSYVIHAPVHIGQIGSNVSRTDLALAMDAASRQTEARILYSMRTKGRFSGS